MEHASDPHVRALIATCIALAVAFAFFLDMCVAGLDHAAPRDGVALAAFVIMRMLAGRGLRGPEP